MWRNDVFESPNNPWKDQLYSPSATGYWGRMYSDKQELAQKVSENSLSYRSDVTAMLLTYATLLLTQF